MLKSIKFIKPYDKYNSAEIAGFEDDEADKLIKRGVAKMYKPKNKAMSKPKVDKMVKQSENKVYTREKLENKYKTELKEIAKEKDITYSRKTKDELIDDILKG